MKNVATAIKNSRRLAIVSVAVALAGIGGIAGGDVAADTLIPRESIGAPAGGGGGSASTSAVWGYELPYEQGRPVLVQQAETATSGGGYYAIVGDQGAVYSPETLETASTGENASSAQSNVQMVCPPCATQV